MKWNKKHIILTLLLPLQIGLVQVLSQYPAFIERYYSNGLYPYISKFLRVLFGWIPFSVGDVIGLILFFCLLRGVYKLIKNRFKHLLTSVLQFTAFLSILYCCFYLFWGLNYFRIPLAKNLGFEQSKYTSEQLKEVTKHIILKLNEAHLNITNNDSLKVVNPYQQKEIYTLARNGYTNLEGDFPQLKYQYSSVKNSLVSKFQSYNGTAGYLNPITGEAQVNRLLPKTSYPTTTCHEMAHQIGYSAENEANFVGFLASIYNKDKYFQYSGYRMAFGYCISEVRKQDKALFKELWLTVNKGISKDFNASYQFWQQYKNPIEPLMKKGYNSYLKANKQTNGIASYSYVVDLLISYFEKNI
ncbi:hypothetical protein LPB136_03910 [Tenacibaculum todarodis]|uniref:Amino acid permease n=1 Tax=Tenacibaculum todarodis TaxID=1850252 RepID=A0A1L3JHH8_9FLAO|nr:hypothetical protein LPB136_03910 [Tenacibaculum todarodis]